MEIEIQIINAFIDGESGGNPAGVVLIEQGHFMKPPSPSVITVKLNFGDGKVTELFTGGKAKVMKSLNISI